MLLKRDLVSYNNLKVEIKLKGDVMNINLLHAALQIILHEFYQCYRDIGIHAH